MRGKKILVIDDDAENLRLMEIIYSKAGCEVMTAASGAEGLVKFHDNRPDLIILDLMLPEMDGFEVCEMIRKISDVPIIMLTGMKRESDALRGLDIGADDYLTKPFSAEMLLARSRAVLRRSGRKFTTGRYDYDDGHLRIDLEGRQVYVNNQNIQLTPTEFRILAFLISHVGQSVTHNQILDKVWGHAYEGFNDYVHVTISTLRRKLGDDQKEPTYIRTIPRVGYFFKREDEP